MELNIGDVGEATADFKSGRRVARWKPLVDKLIEKAPLHPEALSASFEGTADQWKAFRNSFASANSKLKKAGEPYCLLRAVLDDSSAPVYTEDEGYAFEVSCFTSEDEIS